MRINATAGPIALGLGALTRGQVYYRGTGQDDRQYYLCCWDGTQVGVVCLETGMYIKRGECALNGWYPCNAELVVR